MSASSFRSYTPTEFRPIRKRSRQLFGTAGVASGNATQDDQVGIDRLIEMIASCFSRRDGVVNEAPLRDGNLYPPKDAALLRIPAGTAEALGRLKRRGYQQLFSTDFDAIGYARVKVSLLVH